MTDQTIYDIGHSNACVCVSGVSQKGVPNKVSRTLNARRRGVCENTHAKDSNRPHFVPHYTTTVSNSIVIQRHPDRPLYYSQLHNGSEVGS